MEVTCNRCGREFTATRADASYCSGRCRTIAYRVRRDGEQPKRPKRPLPDALRNRTYDLEKLLASLDHLTADDRFPRFRNSAHAARVKADLDRAASKLDEIRARFAPVTRD